jgi:cytidine deaminase
MDMRCPHERSIAILGFYKYFEMLEKNLDRELIDAAIELAKNRFPTEDACVAALKTATGRILTSVCAEAVLDSACLCAETGAICEAHKLNEPVVASVCIDWAASTAEFKILPACGVCQERLAFWGLDVEIAVPSSEPGQTWQFRKLRQLRPFYWNDTVS